MTVCFRHTPDDPESETCPVCKQELKEVEEWRKMMEQRDRILQRIKN